MKRKKPASKGGGRSETSGLRHHHNLRKPTRQKKPVTKTTEKKDGYRFSGREACSKGLNKLGSYSSVYLRASTVASPNTSPITARFREMIIRKQCYKDKFTILSNQVLQDKDLSWASRGLLGYLLSMPPDWKISIPALTKQGNLKRDGLRGVLSELQFAGYIRRVEYRTSEGKFARYDYEVYDIPGYWKGVTGTDALTCDGNHRLKPLKLVVVDSLSRAEETPEERPLCADNQYAGNTVTDNPHTAERGTTKDYKNTKNHNPTTETSSSSSKTNSKKNTSPHHQQQQNTGEVGISTTAAATETAATASEENSDGCTELAAQAAKPAERGTEREPESVGVDGGESFSFSNNLKDKDEEKAEERAKSAQSGKGKAGKATVLVETFEPDEWVVNVLNNRGMPLSFLRTILTEVIYYWTIGQGAGVPKKDWNQVFMDRCIARWEKLDLNTRAGYIEANRYESVTCEEPEQEQEQRYVG